MAQRVVRKTSPLTARTHARIHRAFRAAPYLFGLLLAVPSLLGSCGSEPERAAVIDPSYTYQCSTTGCSGHGRCGATLDGNEACFCELGYVGDACEYCQVGFHWGAGDSCFPDHLCAEQAPDICGAFGACKDDLGVIECACQAGYGGSRCELCADGYQRADDGTCVERPLGNPDLIDSCTEDACNYHGTCTQEAAQGAYCVCSQGYEGSRCGVCSAAYRRDDDGNCVPRETCASDSCGGHGSCSDSSGAIDCTCDPGYGGKRCDRCVAGYHLAGTACAPDLECGVSTCAAHGVCSGSGGILSCDCTPEYDGTHCDRCAFGYRLTDAEQCVFEGCENNPLKSAQNMDFEMSGFPILENNCSSGVQINTDWVTFESTASDTAIAGCGKHPAIYGFESAHIKLQATHDVPARLKFTGKVFSLSFDYGRADVELEVLADGKVLQVLPPKGRQVGHVTIDFYPPITEFALRGPSGEAVDVAIDNLYFAPPPCD